MKMLIAAVAALVTTTASADCPWTGMPQRVTPADVGAPEFKGRFKAHPSKPEWVCYAPQGDIWPDACGTYLLAACTGRYAWGWTRCLAASACTASGTRA